MKKLSLISVLAACAVFSSASLASQPSLLVHETTVEQPLSPLAKPTGGTPQVTVGPTNPITPAGFSIAPGTWSGEGVYMFKGGWSACASTPLIVYNITNIGKLKTPGLQSTVKGLVGLSFQHATNFTTGYDFGLQYTEPAGRAGIGAGLAELFAVGQSPRWGGYLGGFLTVK